MVHKVIVLHSLLFLVEHAMNYQLKILLIEFLIPMRYFFGCIFDTKNEIVNA